MNRFNKSIFFLLVLIIILIDRLTKAYFIKQGCFFLFCINPSVNFGASLGILSGWTLFLIIVAVSVLLIVIYFYFIKNRLNNLANLALIFLFAGTLGNLIDRIFFGYIIDWLTFSFFYFPAFNLADVSNLTGALLLVIYLIKKGKSKKIKKKK